MGLGCWAIGGPYSYMDQSMGWGTVDDRESKRAIHVAIEHGVTLFDTADLYGCGHSETVLGAALRGKRDNVVIASKFGYRIDTAKKECTGHIQLPEDLESALDASLSRLRTDYIDIYQLHLRHCPRSLAADIQASLEVLADKGKIRAYGWSTDDAVRLSAFAPSPRFIVVQQALNVLQGSQDTLDTAEQRGLTVFCRSPLAMGLLSGEWRGKRVATNDLRSRWNLSHGDVPAMIDMIDRIRHILTENGRTPIQGALSWLWAKSKKTVPIPGFRNADQVLESAGAAPKGPLRPEQMSAIDDLVLRNFPDNPWDLR